MDASELASKQDAARDFLDRHKVPARLERMLNDLVLAKPDDPIAFMYEYFSKELKQPVIDHLVGREVLDSRGNPTVEADVHCIVAGKVKLVARGTAPSGASTGSNEALELRDGNEERYLGKGVTKAAGNVSVLLSQAVSGLSVIDLRGADAALCAADGTELKLNVGGNAITAASFAIAQAGAAISEMPLFEHFARVFKHGNATDSYRMPTPMVNILNGGKHAGGKLKVQEFMIVPSQDTSFREAIRRCATVYHHLGRLLVAKCGPSARNLGDEGGFAPLLDTPEQAIDIILEAIVAAKLKPGTDMFLAMDAAASEFYDKETGKYEIVVGQFKTGDEMVEYWAALCDKYPAIVSIEDGLDEKDYDTWAKLCDRIGRRCMIVGDDLFTTNTNLIKQGLAGKWANALLLKVNQIGTVSESMDAASLMLDAGHNVIVSHRSGESVNSDIADLAVGIGARYIKTGAPARGERVAKYNRLLQIEEILIEKNLLGTKQ
eukprot:Opistho-2@21088